jgi:hypothetical protein
MKRMLAGTTAALLLSAGAFTTGGIHSSHAASKIKVLHNADALLWPYQGGNGNNGSGGSSNSNSKMIWQNSDMPGGSFAIVNGGASGLDFILHGKYLQPSQSYTAFIRQTSCGGNGTAGSSGGSGSGNNSNTNTALGNYQLGTQTASAAGAITIAGKLDSSKLPSSFVNGNGSGSSTSSGGSGRGNSSAFSVLVMPSNVTSSNGSSSSASGSSNGPMGYCGIIETPQAVIPLRSMNGSKAQGIALVSRNVTVWWKSNNTFWGGGGGSNGATQVVVFVHGLSSDSVHEEHLHQGTCSKSEGMIEYPLNDIETNGSGLGVAGTLLNITENILNFPDEVMSGSKSSSAKNPPSTAQLSLLVHETNFKPAACGDLPYSKP